MLLHCTGKLCKVWESSRLLSLLCPWRLSLGIVGGWQGCRGVLGLLVGPGIGLARK